MQQLRDSLQQQRDHFTKLLQETDHYINPRIREEVTIALLHAEERAEFSYRSAFIKGLIIGRNLGEDLAEIIAGMNKTCFAHTPSDIDYSSFMPNPVDVQRFRSLLSLESDSLLEFGIEYLDRWVMYNQLFGNSP